MTKMLLVATLLFAALTAFVVHSLPIEKGADASSFLEARQYLNTSGWTNPCTYFYEGVSCTEETTHCLGASQDVRIDAHGADCYYDGTNYLFNNGDKVSVFETAPKNGSTTEIVFGKKKTTVTRSTGGKKVKPYCQAAPASSVSPLHFEWLYL